MGSRETHYEPWFMVRDRKRPWRDPYSIMAWEFSPFKHIHVSSHIGIITSEKYSTWRKILCRYGYVVKWAVKGRNWAKIVMATALAITAVVAVIRLLRDL